MRHPLTTPVRTALFVIAVGVRCALPLTGRLDGRAHAPIVTEAVASPGTSGPCEKETLDLQSRLARVFVRQQRNGEIAFEGADSLFYYHPLMATLALEAFRSNGDYAFLREAHGVLKGYVNYLLVYRDADGDFLIERSSSRDPGHPGDVEDVGFNAMFALDMLSLSRICVELDMPIDGLFWYRGMRTVSRQLVKVSYDPDARLFFPTRPAAQNRERIYNSLSVLPAYFASELGDDISLGTIRDYLLADGGLSPDNPLHYLTWGFSPTERLATLDTRMLRTLLLLGVLESNGLRSEASSRANAVRIEVGKETAANRPGAFLDEIGRFASCKLESQGPYSLFSPCQGLILLDHLVFRKALLEPEQTATFRRSVNEVCRFLSSDPMSESAGASADESPTDLESVTRSIRNVYFSISLLRDRWKQRTLFSQSDRSDMSGFDVYGVVANLWDDVVETLRSAENLVAKARWEASGLKLTAALERTSVAPGEPVPIRFAVSATTEAVRLGTMVVRRQGVVDTLVGSASPLELAPGAAARQFRYLYPTPKGRQSTIVPIACTLEIRFEDGQRFSYHFRNAAFITQPVTCAVRFPRGTTLTDGSVPVEILVKKHLLLGTSIQAQWYSPAGLKPVEGRSLEAWMPEHTQQATMNLNVLVPNPCRPGSFPFTLAVFANGEEAGKITSRLFKHYQWLFVGPFPGKGDVLDPRYPPESRVNLFDTYTGALGQLGWQTLPGKAYIDDGRLDLGSLLPEGSIGFLYTVIESAAPRVSSLLFETNSPAVLYVNGALLSQTTGEASSKSTRFDVALKDGMNNFLIKTLSRGAPVVFFQLGDEEDLMTDEFNNNLWELVDGYEELLDRGRDRSRESDKVQRRVTISYHDPNATTVSVVGSFNGWSSSDSAMRKNKYGDWEINLYLSPGRYTYRFVVNSGVEIVDPTSPYMEPDGYGGQNSVLYVQ